MKLLVTFLIALIGSIIFQKIKFPAGAMVGSMVFTALYNILTKGAYMPPKTRIFTQIIAGAFIGHTIMKKDLKSLKSIIFPAILMIVTMLSLDLFMGYLMFKYTNIDLATSLMASAPGGLMDISLISADVGADSSKVALLQLLRLMTVMAFFPLMIKGVAMRINNWKNPSKHLAKNDENLILNPNCNPINKSNGDESPWYKDERLNRLIYTMSVALVFGILGYFSKLPAGPMTFSLIGTALFNIRTEKGFMPLILRRFTQVLAGILIGSRMTYEDLVSLKTIVIPAFMLLWGIIIINFIVGFIMHKITGIDFITCQLAATPGGLTDTVLISQDLGADQNKVAILQLFRYITVVVFFPILIKYLLTLVG